MINKKLDDITEDIATLKKIFNSTDYFKTLEEVIDKQNNYNKELRLKLNNLQSKIDKANEILNRPQFEYDNIPCNCEEDIKELKEVLKGVENVKNN